jgi:hypothetical protein
MRGMSDVITHYVEDSYVQQTAVGDAAREYDAALRELAQTLPIPGAATQTSAPQANEPVVTSPGRVHAVPTGGRACRRTLKGQKLVAKELEKLGGCWHVLHSIPIGDGGSDINHLVIGPAGVLSLITKHDKNASIHVAGDVMLVAGQRQPYVDNSRHEAQRVGALLSVTCGVPVPAFGVVVPVNARSVTIWEQPGDVHVVNRRKLCEWLLSLPTVLDRGWVERIFDAARLSSTWAPG